MNQICLYYAEIKNFLITEYIFHLCDSPQMYTEGCTGQEFLSILPSIGVHSDGPDAIVDRDDVPEAPRLVVGHHVPYLYTKHSYLTFLLFDYIYNDTETYQELN